MKRLFVVSSRLAQIIRGPTVTTEVPKLKLGSLQPSSASIVLLWIHAAKLAHKFLFVETLDDPRHVEIL